MNGGRRIYLDNAATTPPLPEVIEAMAAAQRDAFGNPSSQHAFGAPARKLLDDAREFLRGTVGAAELVFTSGGTEADLLGVVGSAAARQPGRVLMAASEHAATIECAGLLTRYRHYVTKLPVRASGDLEPETLFAALGADVRTVAILHGHNELGTLSQLDELVSLIRRAAPDAHVHVDLVQSYGKIPFDLDAAGVDSVAVAGHKLHGPRGVGFLALSSKAQIAPLHKAGGQEGGRRGGTENVAGAVGLACAAEAAFTHLAGSAAHTDACCTAIERAISGAFADAVRLGAPQRRLPHILSMRIPGVVGQTLMERCDQRGLAFSVGAACHGARHDDQGPTNHVLAAIGLDAAAAREVFRVSCSRLTTEADAAAAAAILVEEARALRDIAPRSRVYGEPARRR
jgi:cysteine desulfurase